jgi:hypothetical protein
VAEGLGAICQVSHGDIDAPLAADRIEKGDEVADLLPEGAHLEGECSLVPACGRETHDAGMGPFKWSAECVSPTSVFRAVLTTLFWSTVAMTELVPRGHSGDGSSP